MTISCNYSELNPAILSQNVAVTSSRLQTDAGFLSTVFTKDFKRNFIYLFIFHCYFCKYLPLKLYLTGQRGFLNLINGMCPQVSRGWTDFCIGKDDKKGVDGGRGQKHQTCVKSFVHCTFLNMSITSFTRRHIPATFVDCLKLCVWSHPTLAFLIFARPYKDRRGRMDISDLLSTWVFF